MEKKYILITNKNCGPCIRVKNHLDSEFPNWKEYVEVIDVSDISMKEWIVLKLKYKISYTPIMVKFENGKSEFIFSDYYPNKINDFIEQLKK
jgi:hypothetical protein